MFAVDTNTWRGYNPSHPLNVNRILWWSYLPKTNQGTTWLDVIRGVPATGVFTSTVSSRYSASSPPVTRPSGSVSFDGSSQYTTVSSTYAPNLINGFTIACWINPSASNDGNNHLILGRISYGSAGNGTYKLYIKTTGVLGLFDGNIGSFAVSGSQVLSTNKWYFVVATYNGGSATLYIGGANGSIKQDATATYSGFNTTSTEALNIGVNKSGTTQYFAGKIASVSIWNARGMIATDVSALYQNELQGCPGVFNARIRKVASKKPAATARQQMLAMIGCGV